MMVFTSAVLTPGMLAALLISFLIYLWHNDKRFLIGAQSFGKHLHNGLGLVILHRDVVYNNQVVVGNLGGKCGFQCQSLNFLCCRV